ncbi:PREDICTED: serine/threonine-protein kinase pim-1-like, partial [Ficedula albicollis]|uniref:serine/threonine-protein kinase pim-1-like n=1 Tax=Ficedula albicollis TaxID=59894 RepID=UPI0007AD8712
SLSVPLSRSHSLYSRRVRSVFPAPRKAPVAEPAPCPALSGPPLCRLRGALSFVAAAPSEEPLAELGALVVVVLEQHRLLLPRCEPRRPSARPPEPGAAREAAAPGAGECPGPNGESAVPSARAEKPPLEQLYREGPLLGSGGCGSVYAGTRLADGAPVAIKRVPRDRIWEWARLHDGALVPLELVLLSMVSCPAPRTLVMERPERCRDVWHLLQAGGSLPEPVARGLFRQVLQAVRHCTSRGVLHRDIKAENVLVDLASGEAKLMGLGCGTVFQDTIYTWMAECQHLIRWCLSMDPADRPCLEDLLEHSWLQETHLAQETAEIHPSAQ